MRRGRTKDGEEEGKEGKGKDRARNGDRYGRQCDQNSMFGD